MNVAIRSKNTALESSMGIALIFFATGFPLTPTQAETGKGEDVFKVIMTIFGVDKSKGDVVAIVTANNGEASRVKFLDSEAPYVVPINSSGGGGSSSHLVEYVATFPNITVTTGDEYKACVLTTKDLNSDGLICNTGQNSPASRPEFVDISLNATSNTPSEETINGESEGEEEGEGD
jgi:hypothetical protein